jgi:NRAMP (natural resistance-associated macrophage protein)-like metal ion transporter
MKKRFSSLIIFLSILGPGIITANAGNDAGGIATYSSIGAKFGYSMIWGLFIIAISLAIVQEMCARMGVVTGKGLSDLIREQFGVKLTLLAMITLLIANMGVTIAEFAGIAAALELLGISKFIAVPLVALAIWFLLTKGSYSIVEKIFAFLAIVFISYIFSAFLSKPEWGSVLRQSVTPTFKWDRGFILAFIGMIGTTISPYMQFYLQSSIVDKGITLKDYKYEKLDVFIGSFWGNFVAFFIIVSTAAVLFKNGIVIETAEQAAIALKPLAGNFAFLLFAIGLFGASTLAAGVLPLSTSYAICEAFGFESGLDNKFKEAPIFYFIYSFMIFASAAIILIPHISLMGIMVVSQQINGFLLPIILIFMLKLINNKHIMGKHTNGRVYNIIAWATVVFVILLTFVLLGFSVINLF